MKEKQVLLVTGGAGYLGSHTVLELLAAGYEVLVLDNFSNSSPQVLERLEQLAHQPVPWVEGDIRDAALLDRIFRQQREQGQPVAAVVHFAALKAVGESVSQPLRYYENNVHGSVVLCQAMQRHEVNRLIFSSSATVYGQPDSLPFTESHRIAPVNPYGHTKAMVEQVLRDQCYADPHWGVVALRYFNPIGAHPSGLIGEDPRDIPNNLFPYITQVAAGVLPHLQVFGTDYPTLDGTGVRDFIHVVDLARGHVAAVDYVLQHAGFEAVNLGTGKGYSVLELVAAFEQVNGVKVPWQAVARRPGDIAAAWAEVTHAARVLGWRAELDLQAMCADGWRWQQRARDFT